jgi:homoserine O-acetyltransferase
MSALTEIVLYLIQTVLSVYGSAVLLRFLLQWVGADFYNPISQFLVKITAPAVNPLRKIVPGYLGLDLASLLLAVLIHMLAIALSALLLNANVPSWLLLPIWGVVGVCASLLNIIFIAILASIIISWVARGTVNATSPGRHGLFPPVTADRHQRVADSATTHCRWPRFTSSVGAGDISPVSAISQESSVGLVTPQTAHFDEPLNLACGRPLNSYELVYETYGTLNAEHSNAVLICHALSGHHHAAGFHSEQDSKPGWWDSCIGPGKPVDTDHFFVVSLNNLGGCHGSTGPSSIDPATGVPYGPDFPPLRARDWVDSQARLADRLGIQQWAAVIGGSLGGMQAMRWALEYPDRVLHCVVIAAAMKLSAQNIAFNEIARQAILTDPDYCDGRYIENCRTPRYGLALARMLGHVTYLSNDAMDAKFGRDLRSGSFNLGNEEVLEFQVESYLRHQGAVFSDHFDANTYLLMTHALDYFDLAREYDDSPVAAFAKARCNFLVVSFTSDWRFAPERSREIVDALIAARRPVTYANIQSEQGHDSFLLPIPRYRDLFGAYMQRVQKECK